MAELWGVWLHLSETGFILCRLIHSLLFSHVAYSWNFHRSSPTPSASSLFCPLYNKPDSELLADSEEESRRESLHHVSLDSQSRDYFLSTFPASDVSHMASKTHTGQSNQSDEDNNSEQNGVVTAREADECRYWKGREVSDISKVKAIKTHVDTYHPG